MGSKPIRRYMPMAVWAGWMNRLVVATYLAWQFGAAALAARLARG